MSLKTDENILRKIDKLEREVEKLKRDFLKGANRTGKKKTPKPSLFGSVKGGDISEKVINKAKT